MTRPALAPRPSTAASPRAQVLAFVQEYPGVHVREVERRLGLSSRLAAYHLEALAADGVVERIEDHGYARFVPRVTRPRWSPRDLAILCLLRRPIAFRVALLLLADGPAPHGALAARLGLAKASLSYHLEVMRQEGVVAVEARGRQRVYDLVEPERVRGVLADFTPLPDQLDAFGSVWRDLVG